MTRARSYVACEASSMPVEQADLFAEAGRLPDGLAYREDIVTTAEESALVREFRKLDFAPFEFRGFLGKRRVISFGWKYDFATRRVCTAPPAPDFLLALQDRVAAMRPCGSGAFDQVLIAEYEAGAGIGWHRDRPVYRDVVGLSLLSPCRFRLRRAAGRDWERHAFDAAPRSAYLLSGAARWEWEHSIPPVGALRYSITFRRLMQ